MVNENLPEESMRYLTLAVILVHLSAVEAVFCDEPVGTTSLSTEAFCDSVKGNYKIDSANGAKPKPDAEFASIEKDLEAKECIFTFPYCRSGDACDPGYIFLGFSSAKISKTDSSATRADFTILMEQNGKSYRYTLSLDGGKLKFINYQYVLPNGEVVTLEHVGKKNSEN